MSEPQDRVAGSKASGNSSQDRPVQQPSSDMPDSATARPRVPDTIGVYDRPTGLKRYPAWLIALVILIVLASIVYLLFTFVF